MTTTFDKREEGFEKKFALDEEQRFKANARRNKLLGMWAAEKLGIQGPAADAYAKEVVMADFEAPGDDDVLQKVKRTSPRRAWRRVMQIRTAMNDLMEAAIAQPKARADLLDGTLAWLFARPPSRGG